ncbi:hypothetical protein EVAR_8065_1 [Eumeta japonica]|uniref:Uncharacterized protein n=1 Tax=Eumeta variegata TaxID=151549 RepID=A0A4C1TIC8_EUMVA|nr:hypothetical protein EVAR_8065_1 [Eumeta japonica]
MRAKAKEKCFEDEGDAGTGEGSARTKHRLSTTDRRITGAAAGDLRSLFPVPDLFFPSPAPGFSRVLTQPGADLELAMGAISLLTADGFFFRLRLSKDKLSYKKNASFPKRNPRKCRPPNGIPNPRLNIVLTFKTIQKDERVSVKQEDYTTIYDLFVLFIGYWRGKPVSAY